MGDAQHDPVIGRHHLPLQAVPLLDAGTDRECPGRVDPLPQRTVQHHPPVAELVQEPLHHQVLGAGYGTCGFPLLGQVGDHGAGGVLVQTECGEPLAGGGLLQAGDLGLETGDSSSERRWPAHPVAVPEGDTTGQSEGGGDADAVVGDLLDPPGGGAQGDHVPAAGLVHHLLVQLTDPPGLGVVVPGHDVHREQAAVGDRAAAGDHQALGAGPGRERAGLAVMDQPRPQLAEGGGGVAAGQQVDGLVEGGAR